VSENPVCFESLEYDYDNDNDNDNDAECIENQQPFRINQ